MTVRQRFRFSCFALEGLNSFATVLYINYFYFFTRDTFGFDNKHNLALAAWLGFVYTIAAWQAGKFAQRCGYFTALKTGFAMMAAALAAALVFHSAPAQIFVATTVMAGTCFIWPTLEALVSEGETAARLPHAVGIYNVVWAVTNASAFFIGGMLIKMFGFKIILMLPLAIILFQLVMTFWLQKQVAKIPPAALSKPATASSPDPHRPTPEKAKSFLQMAWLANPFAYIAINTLVAVIPGIAAKFQMSPMFAGFICSLWAFIRLGAFLALWRWTGWHYKFRWLVMSFTVLIFSFAAILMSPNLIVLVIAQVFFGGAIGLIYYSSLFYSMDAGDTKGEHGGLHEAAIGVGNCLGPAAGAAALWFAPQNATAGAWAVSGLLAAGLGGLLWLRRQVPDK